ncbi:hypothetical protein SUGI_1492040 [Cryptomeria japonica]|uniref:Uncharacterized protein n=1 Tax=Cryptomeria japonica TaxID=3369 RepID=A0AAD3RRB9_CRYJA|nr:hypothetical protein SUGI_1446860 [Cryptomeria japonica]GLJ59085.1 hypothetical protein SUGI_1492040 [Cryptomeria japonica]
MNADKASEVESPHKPKSKVKFLISIATPTTDLLFPPNPGINKWIARLSSVFPQSRLLPNSRIAIPFLQSITPEKQAYHHSRIGTNKWPWREWNWKRARNREDKEA